MATAIQSFDRDTLLYNATVTIQLADAAGLHNEATHLQRSVVSFKRQLWPQQALAQQVASLRTKLSTMAG